MTSIVMIHVYGQFQFWFEKMSYASIRLFQVKLKGVEIEKGETQYRAVFGMFHIICNKKSLC